MEVSFTSNKYLSWYIEMMIRSLDRPFLSGMLEKHHIIPKSLGGSNDVSNIAKLTPREHFIAHRLLLRVTEGGSRAKMTYALWRMSNSSNTTTRHVATSYQYAEARREFQSRNKGRETSEETKIKLSIALKGKKKTQAHVENMRNGRKGFRHSGETKGAMSETRKALRWYNNGTVQVFSTEPPDATFQRGRLSFTRTPSPLVSCPYCTKSGRGANMNRYHFDNCALFVARDDLFEFSESHI